MAGPAEPTLLSPWPEGMVNKVDPSALEDRAVALAWNLDFELDGSVFSRPAIVKFDAGPRPYTLVDINRAIDPSFEASAGIVGVPGTTGVQSAPALIADNPLEGINSSRVAWTTASTAAGGGLYREYTLAQMGLAVADVISVGIFRARSSINNRLQLSLEFRTDVGTISTVALTQLQVTAATNYGAGTNAELKIENQVIPATTTRIRVRLLSIAGTGYANNSIGSYLQVDGMKVRKAATIGLFFSGATADAGINVYQWGTDDEGVVGTNLSVWYTNDAAQNDSAMMPLGYYVTDAGATYLCIADAVGTWLVNVATKAWTKIWSSVAADCVQYDDKLMLISETVAGGYWDGAAFISTPTMPLGSQIEVLQDRFWASGQPNTANGNRVWFSNQTVITPPSSIYTWSTASDFYEVNSGDGQQVTAIRAFQDKLYIFRTRSTWVFTYPALPIDGTLRQLSNTIGADNAWCVESYEGYFFVLNQGFLYQFLNHQYYPLNSRKIDLERSALDDGQAIDLRVSMLGARCIVWYLGSTFVFNAVSGTWSQWDSPTTRAAHFLQTPADPLTGDDRVAFAVSGEADVAKRVLYRIQESALVTGPGEEIECILRTKAYSFDTPGMFKRQTYWTVEVATARGVEGFLLPQELPPGGATIDDMEGVIIDVFESGSYDNPLVVLSVIESPVEFPSQAPVRIHIEMIRDLHFQRMIYELRGTTAGTRATGPFRIFSMAAVLSLRAKSRVQVS